MSQEAFLNFCRKPEVMRSDAMAVAALLCVCDKDFDAAYAHIRDPGDVIVQQVTKVLITVNAPPKAYVFGDVSIVIAEGES